MLRYLQWLLILNEHFAEWEEEDIVDVLFACFKHEEAVKADGYARALWHGCKGVAKGFVDVWDDIFSGCTGREYFLVFAAVVV